MPIEAAAIEPDVAPFGVAVTTRHGTTVLVLRGELDLAAAPRLREYLVEALAEGAAQVMCDLRQVTFLDSTGLFVLMSANKRARASGVRFAVLAPQPQVDRLFDVSGVKAHLEVILAGEDDVQLD